MKIGHEFQPYLTGFEPNISIATNESEQTDSLQQLAESSALKINELTNNLALRDLEKLAELFGIMRIYRVNNLLPGRLGSLIPFEEGSKYYYAIISVDYGKGEENFTLAHEIGHMVNWKLGFEFGDSSTEDFCDYFAASLLLPDSVISSAFEASGHQTNADSISSIRNALGSESIPEDILKMRIEQYLFGGSEDIR